MSAAGETARVKVETGKIPGYRWVVISLIFVVYTIAFADRANIGIALPHIKEEFSLTNTQAGFLVSAFAAAYALSQIPAAFVLRKLGVRKVLPGFMIATSAVSLVIGAAPSFITMVAGRLMLGIVEAPLAVSVVTTINNWFPKREKGTAAGILLASTKFGPLIVPPLGALIVLALDWRWVFYLFALPGFFLALVWLFAVSDDPAKSRFTTAREVDHINDKTDGVAKSGVIASGARFALLDKLIRAKASAPLSTAKQIFGSLNVWGVGVGYFFVQGIVGVILAWLPTYLTEVKKFAIMDVGFVSAAPFLGAVLGNLLGGIISDRLLDSRRKPMMIVSSASTIVMMYSLTAAPNDAVLLGLLLLLTGFLLSVGYSAFAIYPARLTTRQAFPFALSVLNTGGQAGTALIPLATGVILDHYNWDAVFLFLACCSLGALLVLLCIVEPMGSDEGATLDEKSS